MRKEIDEDGTICYFNEKNEYHREDGPAIEDTNGDKEYWHNGIEYTEIKTDEEWIRFVKLMVFQ